MFQNPFLIRIIGQIFSITQFYTNKHIFSIQQLDWVEILLGVSRDPILCRIKILYQSNIKNVLR
jgi:hypothetical protein